MNSDASRDWTCPCGTVNPTFDPWCSACNEPRPEQAEAQGVAPAYGIIDPDYARVFTIARCLAWSEGYSLAMQGSFTRDLDLLAVPWSDAACEPEHLARRIEDAADLKIIVTPTAGEKPHGRLAWTLRFKGFGDPRWVDLSIMPRLAARPVAPAAPVADVAMLTRILDWQPFTANNSALRLWQLLESNGLSHDQQIASLAASFQETPQP